MMRWRRQPNRAQVGLDLCMAWEDFESCLIRAWETATGKQFGAGGTALHAVFAWADLTNYLPDDSWRVGLAARCDYLSEAHPDTGHMADATRLLRDLEARIRNELGPLAPEERSTRYVPREPL